MREHAILGSGFEAWQLGKNLNLFSQVPNLDSPDSFPATPTDQLCYARYLGCAPKDFSGMNIGWIMGSTAAVLGAAGWAEVGIGIGDFPDEDVSIPINPTITPLAFASIATPITTATNTQHITQVNGTIKAGQGVWALWVVKADTTDPQLRFILNSNHFGKFASRANTRISTNIGTALAFDGAAGGAVIAGVIFHAGYRE